MSDLILKKWGNSQGIRLPKSILDKLGISHNNVKFNVTVKDNSIILKPKKESKLAQRFEGFNYKKYWADWEKENPGKSKEMDWGESVGKEMKW
ncbi:AbrB/MazE/SpoVT family DNA-binding domain-containing protein [Lactobacillus intestinalis]|uniref:AbrB/MazE/SpoVT family DNA-binding domain-containing protein n=1 Tax=Lactobacillus intestinalis TaxID=151781 RepID=UPI0025A94B97|nr:AbrB/MazE/SpoVT family DNA-binding domain-containing protein [Lactobacillus intestinalis]